MARIQESYGRIVYTIADGEVRLVSIPVHPDRIQSGRFGHLAQLVRPALVNGAIGVVMAPRGRLSRALTFKIANGKIT